MHPVIRTFEIGVILASISLILFALFRLDSNTIGYLVATVGSFWVLFQVVDVDRNIKYSEGVTNKQVKGRRSVR
jgi:hypothetical protein